MPLANSVCILSVDDSEATRYARRRILEAAGYCVREAADGREALAAVQQFRPAVVLLDVNLPDMDGYEVCRRLKSDAETAGIAVLQISAIYDGDEARVTALEAGADTYLSEPVDPKVLLATVNALVRMRQAEREQRAANRRLTLLSDTATQLLANQSPGEFMRELFPKIAAELDLEVYFNFMTTGEPAPRLKLHSFGGIPEEVAREIEYLNFGEAVCGWVALNGDRKIVEDVQASADPLVSLIRSLGVTAYACHPLVANGHMLGTLSFGSRRRQKFEDADLELMLAVAKQLAVALDRARLNEQLQTHATRLSAILDNTLAVVYVVDTEGRMLLANRQFQLLFGAVPPGTHLREIFPPEAAEPFLANNRQIFESGQAAEFEETAPQPDGVHTYLSIKVPLRGADGRITAMCGISTDITLRKQADEGLRESERRVRRLVDSNIVGVLMADSERVVEANDIFLNTVGYTREDLNTGKLLWRAMTTPEYAEASARAREQLRTDGAFAPFEKEYLRKDGSRVPVLIGGTSVTDSECLCFVLDLSERKKTEAALREAQKLESLGFLAGGLAHNLNNLLVGIMGNVSLVLADAELAASERERLEGAIHAGERAAALTSQLLAYAGKGRYFPAPTNLSALIERDMAAVLRSSVSRKIDLDFELSRDIPDLKLDANQMRQVITNLVQNAAEAIDNREGRITVKTELRELRAGVDDGFTGPSPTPGAYVVVSVSDTGAGMDAATRSKIFDPFFTTKFTGRGLGLSAVAGIIRAYQGAIRVSSSPGSGCTFEVFLPAPARSLAASARGPIAGVAPARAGVVLVVDDEPAVRDTMRASLERAGYSVLSAGGGARAIELLRQNGEKIGLVLLDLAMPGIGGEETLDWIRALRPKVPVAICSGYSEEQVSLQFSGKDVQGFVKKPFTAQALLAAVASLIKA